MNKMKLIITVMVLPLFLLTVNAQQTWNGSSSDDWEDDANWTPGPYYPDYSEDVTIPSGTPNDPVIRSAQGSPVSCNNLTIDAGATLTITQFGAINIFGDVDNSGDIIVEDHGIFFQDFGTVYTAQAGSTFTLKRTGTSNPMKFNLFSSPVAGQDVSAFSGDSYSFNPATSTASTADDDNDPGWVSASGTLTVGKGYACAGCGTVTFSGVPNNGNLSVGVSYHGGPGVPYNLIGNPYPSPLSIVSFLNSAGNPTDAAGAVYLWDNPASEPYSTSDYATVNLAGTISNGNSSYSSPYTMISSGQGFFVEVLSSTNGTMNFNNSMRGDGYEDNSQFYKTEELQRLWLGATDADSTVYNETLIAFSDSATSGVDRNYDAKKLKGNTRLSLYSVNNDFQYAIQGLPKLTAAITEVPIGVSLNTDNLITFSLKWEESLEGFDIYLKDKLTGHTEDLRNGNYTLQIPEGEHNNRFILIFAQKTSTGINPVVFENLKFNYHEGYLYVFNKGNQTDFLESLALFDMEGKEINRWNNLSLNRNESITLPFMPAHSGLYMVKALIGDKTITGKVRIIN